VNFTKEELTLIYNALAEIQVKVRQAPSVLALLDKVSKQITALNQPVKVESKKAKA